MGLSFLLVLTLFLAQTSAMPPGSPPAAAPPTDVFPVWLGYAGLAAVSGAGGVMGAVIKHLWEKVQKDAADRVTAEKERREDAERLLREQRDIMREVMTTCGALNEALEELSQLIREGRGK